MSEVDWTKFHVGQKVWCVDAVIRPEYTRGYRILPGSGMDGLTQNEIYTIREIGPHFILGDLLISLNEIQRPYPDTLNYQGFNARRFRPLREQNIEIFRQMCRDVTDKVSA